MSSHVGKHEHYFLIFSSQKIDILVQVRICLLILCYDFMWRISNFFSSNSLIVTDNEICVLYSAIHIYLILQILHNLFIFVWFIGDKSEN